MVSFFFFQAEDGIRDVAVTGVQTCALPISLVAPARREDRGRSSFSSPGCDAVDAPGAAWARPRAVARHAARPRPLDALSRRAAARATPPRARLLARAPARAPAPAQ